MHRLLALHLSAGASTSFRSPTLNELYRSFRVRNDQDIQTGLASNNLLSLGAPRTYLLTAR